MWQCNYCQCVNNTGKEQCFYCGAPRKSFEQEPQPVLGGTAYTMFGTYMLPHIGWIPNNHISMSVMK